MASGRLIAVISAVALLIAACASNGHPNRNSGRSNTPRITNPPRPSSLASALLTTKDLRSVPGVAPTAEVRSVDKTDLFVNPDPRGPCGARVDQPALGDGAIEAIIWPDGEGFEAVVDLPPQRAASFLSQERADTRPGCAGYDSRTNTGSTQHAQLIRPISLDGVGDDRTAAQLTITNNAITFHAAEIAIRSGGRVAMIAIFSRTAIDNPVIQGLARRAAGRLPSSR